jgi:thiamine pyrophosphokinase
VQEEVVVVVAGGEAPPEEAVRELPPGVRVVAADRGVDHALALGLDVELAIGDFDSASPSALAKAHEDGARVERHPEDKDATDLELALSAALELEPEPDRILVLAGVGQRLDHLLAALLLLGSPRYDGVEVDAVIGDARIHVIRGTRTLAGLPGELVSLLPLHGSAEGVRTEGLEYPLAGETLEAGSSRGVSNRLTGEAARVAVERGILLAVRPGPESPGPKSEERA